MTKKKRPVEPVAAVDPVEKSIIGALLGAPLVIHLHLHDDLGAPSPEMLSKLDTILARLGTLLHMGESDMTTVKDVQDRVTALQASVESETSVVESVKVLIEGQNALLEDLRRQLAEAIAAGADPVALQAVVDQLDAITQTNAANAAKLADAVVNGTNTGGGPTPASKR